MDTFDVEESMSRVKFDPLASSNNNNNSIGRGSQKHMQTYTAGEDGSRLAAAAKELGLQQARQPRKQVRHRRSKSHSLLSNPADVLHLLLDSATEDARMRAIYSSHADFSVDDDDEIIDPHADGVGGDLVSAVLGIIKGMVGPAILYLPHGFASAGYLVAVPIMMCTTCMFLFSSSCLLDAWKLENAKQLADTTEPNSTETTRLVVAAKPKRRHMLSYPELAYRALGSSGESLVKMGIALMQSGVCLTYLIFVPQNLHTSLMHIFGVNVSPSVLLVAMIAVQIPLSWIRDIRRLTPTNLAANSLILYGLGVCLYFAVSKSLLGTNDVAIFNVWNHLSSLHPLAQDWFLFIGTSVLLFEGSITLLVPLQEAVESEEQRAQFPTVYRKVILGIICFYAFFGITCWMSFGDDVRTVLTTSLPEGVLATTVQLAYSVAVIFTFPLQNFPALEITTRTILSKLDGSGAGRKQQPRETGLWTRRNFLSSCLVALLALVAVCTMDSLDKVVSLMGSLLGCPIAFVFPPLIHSQLDPTISRNRLVLNYAVAALGIAAMVVASITTLMAW